MLDYESLKKELIKASDAYYKNSEPIMSDNEFDSKLAQLRSIESERGYADDDSPTLKPGSDVVDKNNLKKHRRRMLSLEDYRNKDDIARWFNYLKEFESEPEIVCEYKFDGNSAAITYKDGKITKALTRGDGYEGEDITRNAKNIPSCNISFNGEVRGEILMSHKEFERIQKEENKVYKNPRNLTSGTLKLLDENEFKKRNLLFYAYWNEDSKNSRYSDDLIDLKNAGFNTGRYFICHSIEDILKALEDIKKDKGSLPYDIDGAVLKVNNKRLWKKMGETEKFPRYAKCYKYEQLYAESIITDIKFQVGYSGKITPLAYFNPVELNGSTIQKATLSNKNIMEKLDARIGSKIKVRKACEIIPEIFECKNDSSSKKVSFPTVCPCCGTKLIKKSYEQVDYFCPNKNCKEKVIQLISKYTHTLNIDGFDSVLIGKLYDAEILTSILDLYSLKDNIKKASSIERVSENILNKLCSNIEASKNEPVYKVIAGLGIPNVGLKTAKIIVKNIGSIQNLQNITAESLIKIDNIAEITANSIVSYMKENMDLINNLISFGIRTTGDIINKSNISEKVFCITGKLSRPRNEIVKIIESNNGVVSSSVSKNTDYLITDDPNSNSSKAVNARKFNVKIISEDDFLKLI